MNSAVTSHEVTIILFARLYYPQFKSLKEINNKLYPKLGSVSSTALDMLHSCFNINKEKEIFQDVYFKCGVFEPSRNNWEQILKKLKRTFNYFPSLIRWKINNYTVKSLSKAYPAESYAKNSAFLVDSSALTEQFVK